MPLVAASGAATFRVPQGAIDDALVEAAAKANVTILAQLGGGSALPSNRTAFREGVAALVGRYGVNGKFWSGHPGLPSRPITTWEVWNEPNLKGIPPAEYGPFLNEVAVTIHTSSLGGSPEVLFGGLLANGNLGPSSGTWQQMYQEGKGTTFKAALKYLEEAYGAFATQATGGVPNVTGVAIHPYELNEVSFYEPPGGPRYDRIKAFRHAVGGFRAKLNELASSKGGGQKSLAITETGWPAEGSEWSVGEGGQATLLGQAIAYARNNEAALGLKHFDWYNFRDAAGETTGWARYCGLRADNGSFRSSWTEFQAQAGVPQFIPQAPAAATSNPSQVLEKQATLNGFLNPRGLPTSYWFEYGTTPSYGNSTPTVAAGAGKSDLAASATINGLQPNTTYYYRLNTENAVGRNSGPMYSFKTPQAFVGFQANTGSMLDYQSSYQAALDTKGGMAAGTSPSVAYVPGTGYVMAFQDWHNELWLYNATSGSWIKTGSGMAAGTSPSIGVKSDGTYVVAFQDWQKNLWIYSSATGTAFNTTLGMFGGTSPSVATNGTYYVVAFEANNNELWYYFSGGQAVPTGMGMNSGTSPSVAYAENSNYVIAFQDWQKKLWVYSTASGTAINTNLGMLGGTSPSVATNGTYYLVAFNANNNELWYYFSGGQAVPTGMGMASGTSPSVAYAENSNYLIAFQDWQKYLWTYSTSTGVGSNTKYGMLGGTSPSIVFR
jgi:glycerol-3-phosphate acyltransferase PlsY